MKVTCIYVCMYVCVYTICMCAHLLSEIVVALGDEAAQFPAGEMAKIGLAF